LHKARVGAPHGLGPDEWVCDRANPNPRQAGGEPPFGAAQDKPHFKWAVPSLDPRKKKASRIGRPLKFLG